MSKFFHKILTLFIHFHLKTWNEKNFPPVIFFFYFFARILFYMLKISYFHPPKIKSHPHHHLFSFRFYFRFLQLTAEKSTFLFIIKTPAPQSPLWKQTGVISVDGLWLCFQSTVPPTVTLHPDKGLQMIPLDWTTAPARVHTRNANEASLH